MNGVICSAALARAEWLWPFDYNLLSTLAASASDVFHFVLRGCEIERAPQRPLNGYKQGWLVYTHSLLIEFNSAVEAAEFLKGLHQLATIQAFVCGVVLFCLSAPSLCRHSMEIGVFLQFLTHRIHREPR